MGMRHGVNRTARALRLDYYSLKERAENEASSASETHGDAASTFLELATPATASTCECILELEDVAGAKMRVHLKSVEAPDYRDQFLGGPADGLTVLEQPLAFLRLRVDLARNPSPQCLVLLFEIFDIFCQLIVGRGGNQGQQGMENLTHGCIVVSCNLKGNYTFVVQRYVIVESPNRGLRMRLVRRQLALPSQRRSE